MGVGKGEGVSKQLKTQCIHGHPYDAENTLYLGGKRRCRECRNAYQRLYMKRYRARLAERKSP